jgi:hypothetical protein
MFEAWSFALIKPKTEKEIGVWRKLHNEKLYAYTSHEILG